MKSITLIVFLLITCSIAYPQKFGWQAKVQKAPKTGFYDILLGHDILSKMNPDYSDIRIYDKDNNEIPYLLHSEVPEVQTSLFKEYEIKEIAHNRLKGYSRLVIHNPKKNEITSFILSIRNSDVKKWLTLNASDDNKNWYVLKDHYYYESVAGNSSTSEIRVLNFPLSNYEYYELIIYDYFNEPIQILKAGYYDMTKENGKYSEIDNPVTIQNDTIEKKKSIIGIRFQEEKYIDKLQLQIEYPTFYFRNATLCVKDSFMSKNTKKFTYNEIHRFDLSSNSNNTFTFNTLKAKDLYVIVSNNDDKPLKIKEVKAFNLNTYLTARIKSDNEYYLRFGDKQSTAPVYDLAYFKDSIPKKNALIMATDITKSKPDDGGKTKKSNMLYIWLAIGLVIIVLGFMSYKMLSEMKKPS